MKKWVCDLCGYVYDSSEGDSVGGIKAGTDFTAIPDSWVCPLCGAKKDVFYSVDA